MAPALGLWWWWCPSCLSLWCCPPDSRSRSHSPPWWAGSCRHYFHRRWRCSCQPPSGPHCKEHLTHNKLFILLLGSRPGCHWEFYSTYTFIMWTPLYLCAVLTEYFYSGWFQLLKSFLFPVCSVSNGSNGRNVYFTSLINIISDWLGWLRTHPCRGPAPC